MHKYDYVKKTFYNDNFITPNLIDWIFNKGKIKDLKKNKENTKLEIKFLASLFTHFGIDENNTQWSNYLGEKLVVHFLRQLGHVGIQTQHRIKDKMINNTSNTYIMDILTNTGVYEVKTRNYTTSGTAGDKILGVPSKYYMIPEITKKPFNIVLVGYQEEEAYNWNVYNDKNPMIEYAKTMGFHYVKCSELLYDCAIKTNLHICHSEIRNKTPLQI